MTLVVLVFYRFPQKNRTLQTASIVIIPWFLLFSFGGAPGELRYLFDIFPVILLLMVQSLVQLIMGERGMEGREESNKYTRRSSAKADTSAVQETSGTP